MFIDTAGLRKNSKVNENIERYSVVRSYMAVDRADVVLIMIDANEGVTEQDLPRSRALRMSAARLPLSL